MEIPEPVTAAETGQGFIYGRITIDGGDTYEGRLRWGGDEEAFWSHHFNGRKEGNPWVAHLAAEQLTERRPVEVFGVEVAQRDREINFSRPFMARFGDIARIEATGARDLRVVLKSGTVVDLDRMESDDFGDGVRVWDAKRGVVDLAERQIRSIELLKEPAGAASPTSLFGTVRTRGGQDFTGFVQWDRKECVGPDELEGNTSDARLRIRFDSIRSIARHPQDGSLVTLIDGREIALSGTRKVGRGNRGVYVDNQRYGRVLIEWDDFDRIDFTDGGLGRSYDDFPPGRPLTGMVTTHTGRRLSGRLVYDLDESETIETLDAPSQSVNYTIPFGLIASITVPSSKTAGAQTIGVTLHSGESLQLERAGDLSDANGGMLILDAEPEGSEYVAWAEVARVDFDRAPASDSPNALEGSSN